jgi:cellulose synthase operon protein C
MSIDPVSSPGLFARREPRGRRRRALAVLCGLAATAAAHAAPEPAAGRGDPKPATRPPEIGAQAAAITMRVLRAQADLLDMQEALGASGLTLPGPDAPGAGGGPSSNIDEVLVSTEREVAGLERLLDSSRGPPPASGLAIPDRWSSGALLQHPGDRGPFRDDAGYRVALLRLADALRAHRLWAGALSGYERLLSPRLPEAGAALTGAIECRVRLGDFREAVDLLDQARQVRDAPGAERPATPIPAEAVYLAGTAAFRRTDLPPDVRDRKALEILAAVGPPFDVPAAYYRGATHVRAGDIDRAIPEFESCDRLPAGEPRHRAQQELCRLALARIDGDRWPWDGERYWYSRLSPESPDFREATYEQAWEHHRAGSERLALALVDALPAGDPESPLAVKTALLRAGILSALGRHDEAVLSYARIRRQAAAMRDELDAALRAERGPTAYLEWFTMGPDRGGPPPNVPRQAIRRARETAEVRKAQEAWGDLETAAQTLARARTSSDRLDGMVSREMEQAIAGQPGPGISATAAIAERAQALDERMAAEEARFPAGPPGELAGAWKDRLAATSALRLRLHQLRVRATRDERRLVELRGAGDRQAPAGLVEEQRTLAEAQRELDRLRADAVEALGLQVHQSLLEVRTQLDRTVLQADRGVVEVALARTKDAEKRVESLAFRSRVEATFPPRPSRPETLATLEDRSREAESEGRRVREEAVLQLNEYVRLHEDDPVYAPQALARLAELQVEGGAVGQAPRPAPELKGCATAVELHRRITKGFPEYRQRDAVYFLAGYCLAEAGKASEARQAYAELIRRYPDSPHVAEAWVRIGDLDFADGRPDALSRAAGAYAKAAARRDQPLYEHAMYMLGWTQYRQDDLPRALDTLRALLDRELTTRREGKEDLPVSAVNLLGTVLADPRWDGVARARAIFPPGGAHPYEAAIYRRLGDELFEQARYARAAEAYTSALARSPFAPDAPRLQERIVLCWSREGRPQEEARERERLVVAYGEGSDWAKRNPGAGGHSEEVRELVATSRAQSAATLHARAKELLRAGNRKEAAVEYRRAARAYGAILESSPKVKGADGLALARAECTFGAGDLEAAARQYEAVRDASADPRYQQEAAREAVRAWEAEATRQREAGLLAGREPPLPPVLRSLVSAADVLVGRFPDDPLAPPAALRAGECYQQIRDDAEARRRFEQVVERWPGTEAARTASRLVVETHLASKDWAAGEAAASRLRQQASPRDAGLATELQGLELASRFQRATGLMDERKWGEAAALFQAIAEEAPRHALADKALYNAAICQERDRRPEAAAALFGRVVADHPGSPYAPDSLLRQAAIAEAAFDFGKAAERYQVLLEKYPGAKPARDALYDRARALEILQRYEQAGEAFERHASLAPPAEDAPATLLHASEVYEKGAAWPRVLRSLQELQRRYPKGADPDAAVLAPLRAARAESRLGREPAARAAWGKAVSEFTSRGLEPGAHPAGAAAAAEARFRLAELELPKFERAALPATAQASRLEKALKAQLAEATRLTSLYEEVKRYQRPDWTVAALYRQGTIAQRFARILREAPVPPELGRAGQEQELAAYREQLSTAALPYDEQAVQAYARATRLAGERRVETEWSRGAADRLAELRPAEPGHLLRARGRFLPESPARPDEEELLARGALAKDGRDAAAMVRLALVSLARGRVELARAILSSAGEIAPGDAAVWNALGRLDLALGLRPQAEARWRKAIELAPGDADALANLGQLLVDAGDPVGGAAALEQAVRSAPGSAGARLDLGNAYRGLGRVDEARRAYEEALALDPGLDDARFNLGLLPAEAGKVSTSGGVR